MRKEVDRSEESIETGKTHRRALTPFIVEEIDVEVGDELVHCHVIDNLQARMHDILPENGRGSAYAAIDFLRMTDKIPEKFRPLMAVLENHDIPKLELKEKNVVVDGIREIQKYARQHKIEDMDIFLAELQLYLAHLIRHYIAKIEDNELGYELDEHDAYKCAEFIKGNDYIEFLLQSKERIHKPPLQWYAIGDDQNVIHNHITQDLFLFNSSQYDGEFETDYYDTRLCNGAGKYYATTRCIGFFVRDDEYYSDEIKEKGFVQGENYILINKGLLEMSEIGAGVFVEQVFLESYDKEYNLGKLEAERRAIDYIIEYGDQDSLDIFYVLEHHEKLLKGLFENYAKTQRPVSLEQYKRVKSRENELIKAIFGSGGEKVEKLPDNLQKKRDNYVEFWQVYQYVKKMNEMYRTKLHMITKEATKSNDMEKIGAIMEFNKRKNEIGST